MVRRPLGLSSTVPISLLPQAPHKVVAQVRLGLLPHRMLLHRLLHSILTGLPRTVRFQFRLLPLLAPH